MTRKAAIIYLILSFLGLNIFLRRHLLFNKNHYNFNDFEEIISELTDLIIPATDTPGAREANVHKFIINFANNCMSPLEKYNFGSGLEGVKTYISPSGKTFLTESREEKEKYLFDLDKSLFRFHPLQIKIQQKVVGPSFYDQIRWLTVLGFCQSRLGATEALAYDYVPGRFLSCIPLQHYQKSWATN